MKEKIIVEKQIKETKCICKTCNNVWYYGKEDEFQKKQTDLHNVSKAMMCCGGCLPALLIPDKKPIDLDKCPKCGSRVIEKEIIIHNV